jgi:hypothetical protein
MSTSSESAASDAGVARPLSSPPSKPAPPASFASTPASASAPPPPPPPPVVAGTSSVAVPTTVGLPPAYGGRPPASATARSMQPERTSGWEKVDKVASTGEAVVNGIGTVIVKIYGVILIVLGIIVLVGLNNPSRLFGLLISAYGVYLVAPGSKFVIY